MSSERFRDFDAFVAEQRKEPISFQLGGRKWVAEYANDTMTFLKFGRTQGNPGEGVKGFEEYLTGMLKEKDREPFLAMLDAKHIPMTATRELVGWVFATAVGVPLEEVSSLPPVQSETGALLRVVSADRTSVRVEPASAVS